MFGSNWMVYFIISYRIKSKGGDEFGVQASACGWGDVLRQPRWSVDSKQAIPWILETNHWMLEFMRSWSTFSKRMTGLYRPALFIGYDRIKKPICYESAFSWIIRKLGISSVFGVGRQPPAGSEPAGGYTFPPTTEVIPNWAKALNICCLLTPTPGYPISSATFR